MAGFVLAAGCKLSWRGFVVECRLFDGVAGVERPLVIRDLGILPSLWGRFWLESKDLEIR